MSGRPCSVCRHAERAAIDEALVRGDSLRDVEGRFGKTGTSKSALARHRPHVGRALVKAEEARQDEEAETLLDKVKALEADAHRLAKKAEDGDDVRAALVAIDRLLEIVRLLHELTPTPEPSEADVMRELAWFADEIGIPVDELRASCEEIVRIKAEILAGRTPPHTERPVAVAPDGTTPF